MTPFFSIILPVYNVQAYLERCVQSIVEQDYRDYEIILVNDGSTDQSGALCDQFAAQYDFVQVVHKENGGLSSARNAGLQAARGQYIWWVDSDDWIEPGSLRLLARLAEETGSDMIKFNYFRVSDRKEPFSSNAAEGVHTGGAEMEALLNQAFLSAGKFCLSAWSHVYRREFLTEQQLSFVSERVVASEDYLFNLEAYMAANRVCVSPEKLYCYELRQGSLTQQGYRKNLAPRYTELYRRLVSCYDRLGKKERFMDRISYFYVWHLLYGTCIPNEYTVSPGHSMKDGRRGVRVFLGTEEFRGAAKNCRWTGFTWKKRLQHAAMELRFEPLFYWLFVVKPKMKKDNQP